MDEYRAWLKENNYDWEDPKLSLGYIKIGQVDLQRTFGSSATFKEIYETMSKNLNITTSKQCQTGPSSVNIRTHWTATIGNRYKWKD